MQFLKGSLGPEEAACVLINSNFTTFLSRVCFLPSSSLCCPFSLLPQLNPLFLLLFFFLPSRGDASPGSEAGRWWWWWLGGGF